MFICSLIKSNLTVCVCVLQVHGPLPGAGLSHDGQPEDHLPAEGALQRRDHAHEDKVRAFFSDGSFSGSYTLCCYFNLRGNLNTGLDAV